MTSYGLDPVGRLSTLAENFTGTANDQSATFNYSPASQITSLTKTNDLYAWTGHGSGSTASIANGLNQLTSIGGSATTHDSKGNLTTDPTTGKTYGYSSENLLISSTGGTSATLAYDPQMRLYQLAGAATTRFAYDGLAMIAEYNGSNALQRRFVHGPGVDEPLVRYEGNGTTNRSWLHADERGSLIAHSDGSGNVTTINKYDEFGKLQAGNVGRFQYTGQAWLSEIGVYYYKTRVYAAHLGRFLQTDSAGYAGGTNLYAYVLNSPISFTDPLGLIVCTGSRINTDSCANSPNPVSCSGGCGEFYNGPQAAAQQRLTPEELRAAYDHIAACAADANACLQSASILLGEHDYTAGPNLICPAAWGCSAELVGHVYSQVGNQIPGNEGDPRAIVSGGTYYVALGPIGLGHVQSYVGQGGLTVNNITTIDHLAYNGWVNRNAVLTSDGWYSVTHGSGTNYYLGVFNAIVNQFAGPAPFNSLDRAIRSQLYQITHSSRSVRY